MAGRVAFRGARLRARSSCSPFATGPAHFSSVSCACTRRCSRRACRARAALRRPARSMPSRRCSSTGRCGARSSPRGASCAATRGAATATIRLAGSASHARTGSRLHASPRAKSRQTPDPAPSPVVPTPFPHRLHGGPHVSPDQYAHAATPAARAHRDRPRRVPGPALLLVWPDGVLVRPHRQLPHVPHRRPRRPRRARSGGT